jgi:hypothetical protein
MFSSSQRAGSKERERDHVEEATRIYMGGGVSAGGGFDVDLVSRASDLQVCFGVLCLFFYFIFGFAVRGCAPEETCMVIYRST